MPARKTEKPIFDGITVAVAGDLGQGWTETHVTQWVKLRKGNFAQEIDESVTHLVCSLDEYKKKTRKGTYIYIHPCLPGQPSGSPGSRPAFPFS